MRDVIMRAAVQVACRKHTPRLPSWGAGALVALALLLLVGDLPVVHGHDKPGLYNEECPLARLAAGGPRAALASSPDPMVLLRAPETLPVTPRAVPPQVSPASFQPRAPPPRPLLPSRALIG
jgi:hypothetical protein